MTKKTTATAKAPAQPELLHFWMVAGQVNFKQADQTVAGAMINLLVSNKEPKINHVVLDNIHRRFAGRMFETHQVNPNDIVAMTILNISYCGEQTEEEMFGPKPAEEPAANEQATPHHNA